MSGGRVERGKYTEVRSQPKCTSKQLASTMIKPSQLHPVLIKLSTMYFDAHCHLDFNAFDGDRGHVFERAEAVGVSRFVVAGVHPNDWPRQRKLAREQPGVFWTAGIHPVAAAQMSAHALSDGLTALPREWERSPGPVGVGEMGLDVRFAARETLPQQCTAFQTQLALARELNVPVVLHVVGAHGRVLEILRRDGLPERGGMVHSFSGHKNIASDYLNLGLHISFSGSVCRPNALKAREAAAWVPKDRILVETDCPDQSIVHGQRNEPRSLIEVARELAKLRGCETDAILRISARNCSDLFAVERPAAKSI